MNSLFQAGQELQLFILKKKWTFCFIGGLAVIRWGEVRMTQDIDLCLLTGFEKEDFYVNEILSSFKSRVPDAENFARKNRVLLISASNGVSVDLSLSGIEFERQMFERASFFDYSSTCSLLTCSAEDLIVLKAFADRVKDWIDIEGILLRQGQALDAQHIIKQLTPLAGLKEEPEIIDKLKKMISETAG